MIFILDLITWQIYLLSSYLEAGSMPARFFSLATGDWISKIIDNPLIEYRWGSCSESM